MLIDINMFVCSYLGTKERKLVLLYVHDYMRVYVFVSALHNA